ncbi:MAG: isoprenylcysteine carboxylmethyltransferase family protein [Bacteroidales bacterium]|nr:isoprenylcysteine carboxylmethyltransferase family protein [Bacteroidales bacterium]
MDKIILFILLSIPIIVISRRALFDFRSHGFYRFFSWEGIILLFTLNYSYWFKDPFSLQQVVSWLFLVISAYLVITGVITLRKRGIPAGQREDPALFQFEKTSELVTTGIFKYIRHPLYSSLLFITWGIWLKNPVMTGLFIALASSVLLFFTAKADEDECVAFFGERYTDYMSRTKRFIPFIF